MMWGIVEKPGFIHIVPCTESGVVLHECTLNCECLPRIRQEYGEIPMILHNDWN